MPPASLLSATNLVCVSGYVLTRVVCKGAEALGILKEHAAELDVLEALLAQRRWRVGRRGAWYDRRALILTRYFPKEAEVRKRAMDGVVEALRDEDTHLCTSHCFCTLSLPVYHDLEC